MSEIENAPVGTRELTAEDRYLATAEKLENLSKELAFYKQEATQRKILDELTFVCERLRVPQHIIKYELPRYICDFCITSDGKVVSKADESLDARAIVAAMQKERIHWTTPTVVAGNEPMKGIVYNDTPNTHAAIVDQQAKKWFDKH